MGCWGDNTGTIAKERGQNVEQMCRFNEFIWVPLGYCHIVTMGVWMCWLLLGLSPEEANWGWDIYARHNITVQETGFSKAQLFRGHTNNNNAYRHNLLLQSPAKEGMTVLLWPCIVSSLQRTNPWVAVAAVTTKYKSDLAASYHQRQNQLNWDTPSWELSS